MRFSVVALVTALAVAAGAQEFGPQPLALFDPAPELSVKVVKGKPVTLAEGKGEKVYVVEFWATWCAPCKYSIPHLSALQRKYASQGLVVIGISDEDLATVQPYVAKMGDEMDYTVALDENKATGNRYMKPFGLNSIPQAFVIDKDGRIIWYGHPMDPVLEELVDAVLEAPSEAEQAREGHEVDDTEDGPHADEAVVESVKEGKAPSN